MSSTSKLTLSTLFRFK